MERHLWMQTKGKVAAMFLCRRYALILISCIVGTTVGCVPADCINDSCGLTPSPGMTNKSDLGCLAPSSSTNSYHLCRFDSDLLSSNILWSVDVCRRVDDTILAVPRRGTISDIKANFSATSACGTESQCVTEHTEMFSISGYLLSLTWIGDFKGNYYDVRICAFLTQKINALGHNVFALYTDEYELCYYRTFNRVNDVVVTQESGNCKIIVYGDMNPCSEGREEVILRRRENVDFSSFFSPSVL